MKARAVVGSIGILTLVISGCAKTPVATMASAPPPTGAATAGAGSAHDTSSPAPASHQERAAPLPTSRPAPSEFVSVKDLPDVHFDFDRYVIRQDDTRILDGHAGWLKQNAHDLLLIEGHSDERGTNEYNLALGERRAAAVMHYLVAQGIDARRITTVSYGKERPQCSEHNEACWAKNRRAHFLVKHG